MEQNNFTVERRWENDGMLFYRNAKTLDKYEKIQDKIYHLNTKGMGIFFAFSVEQFKEGIQDLKERGLLKEGDRLVKHSGGFGTQAAWDAYDKRIKELAAEMSKCDPYEVYCYEYNNYECCLDMDGDERAVAALLRIWDKDTVKEALAGRRFDSGKSVEQIHEEMYHN